MSRGLPVVVLDHAAEPLAAADFVRRGGPGSDRWLAAHRRGESEGHVRPLAVVVVDVLGQKMVKMPRAQDDEVIEAFDLDALDQPLDVGVEVRRPVRQLHGADPVGKFIGRAASAVWGAAKHYAAKAGKFLGRMYGGLIDRAASWLAKGCGCFEEGTDVQTTRGLVPINQLCVGDEVFAQDEVTGEVSLRRVVRTFVRKAAPIVAVTLIGSATPAVANGGAMPNGADSGLVTLNTTEEHPFLVEASAGDAHVGPTTGRWVQAASLKPGDEVLTASGEPAVVVSIQFTGRRATVYNIEVEGLHNYRVGPDGVVVHNANFCQLFQQMAGSLAGKSGGITYSAQFVRQGSHLSIYNIGLQGEVGDQAFRRFKRFVDDEAKAAGATRVRLEGIRSKDGRMVDLEYDL